MAGASRQVVAGDAVCMFVQKHGAGRRRRPFVAFVALEGLREMHPDPRVARLCALGAN